jgi:hypothetical protein
MHVSFRSDPRWLVTGVADVCASVVWWWSNKLEAKSWSQGFHFGRAPSPSKTRFGWLMHCFCAQEKRTES